MWSSLKLMKGESANYLKFVFKGRFIAYLIGLVSTPVVMRFFEPSLYGEVTIAIMTGTILGQASTLAFEKASLVQRNEKDADLVRQLAALFSIGGCIFSAAVLAAFYLFGYVAFVQEAHGLYVVVAMICEALVCIVIAKRISRHQTSTVANGEVIQSVITSFGRIAAGFLGFISISTLFLWYSLGIISKILYLHFDWNLRTVRGSLYNLKSEDVKRLFADNSDFPKYNVPTGLLNQLTTYLPLFIFGLFFGPVIAGFYAIARRFIKAPGNLFVNMVTPILIKRFSLITDNRQDFRASLIRTALIFGFCGVCCAFGVLIFTTFVLSKVMTVEWSNASTMLHVLLPMVVIPFISAPVSAAMTAMRQQKRYLSNQTFIAILRILALIIAILLDLPWDYAACVFAWVSIMLTSVSSFFLYRRTLLI